MYYVYALMDLRDNLPFYIGKGLKANNRHLDHFNETVASSGNRHKTYKIQHLRSIGVDIPVAILADDILDESIAYQIEASYIKQYGRVNIDQGGILTNICMDNRPPNHTGRKQSLTHTLNRVNSYRETCATVGKQKHSEAAKKKMSRPGELNPFFGKSHTVANKQAHSLRMTGNKNNSKEFVFTSPAGIESVVVGSFAKFCVDNNLTISTMEKVLQYNKLPSRGKCTGWMVRHKNNRDSE